MDLQALGWNKNAVQFYMKRGAVNTTARDSRALLRVEHAALQATAGRKGLTQVLAGEVMC